MSIKTFESFRDFLHFNQSYILSDYYMHYHFIHALDEINNGDIKVRRAFNIISSNNLTIICIWVDGTIFCYSREWDKKLVQELSNTIMFTEYSNFTFVGQTELIHEIIRVNCISPNEVRDRLVYTCTDTVQFRNPYNIKDVFVEVPTLDHIDQLVDLNMEYYNYEFNEKGSKSYEDILLGTTNAVSSGTLYCLRIEQTIHSIAQIISFDRNKPIIGNLYTKPSSRGNGYGTKVLYEITNKILTGGYPVCGLYSSADDIPSNKLFRNIGYTSSGQLSLAFV